MDVTDKNPGDGQKVLIIEDHVDSARAMAKLLREPDRQIEVAHGVIDARRLSQTIMFDLVISDILLPDGSGLELVRELRASSPSLKAIAVSGLDSPGDVQQCKDAGFTAHITKPVDFLRLRDLIHEVMKPAG